MKVQILESDVVWRELDGEVVILNLATGNYYGLEGEANEMWRLLIAHGSTEEVAAIMSREYDVDAARLVRDLDALVHDLASRSIVALEPSA